MTFIVRQPALTRIMTAINSGTKPKAKVKPKSPKIGFMRSHWEMLQIVLVTMRMPKKKLDAMTA
jgi:hypothetical protein